MEEIFVLLKPTSANITEPPVIIINESVKSDNNYVDKVLDEIENSFNKSNLRIEAVVNSPKGDPDQEESSDIYVAPEVRLEYIINDVVFDLTIEGECFELKHPIWSLSAEGSSLLRAEMALIVEAQDLSLVFLDIPLSELDNNAMGMRNFLLKVI